MSQKKAIKYLKEIIDKAEVQVKRYQGLIDEWDDPKDIAVRSAVMLKETHLQYAKSAQFVIRILEIES